MIRLDIIGHIGRDCIVRDVQGSNQKSISFSVAHSEKWRDTAGTQHEKTTWVNCTLWRNADKTAIAQYLTKGTLVHITGIPEARAYTGNDGVNKAELQLRVKDIELLGGGNRQDQPAQPSATSQAAPYYAPAPTPSGATTSGTEIQTAADQGDDLPF
jgi:single-strand DNA-binding protein